MGRMHTHRRGKSHSIRPAILRTPSWVTQSPTEIEELVIKYTKDGLTPSQIGIKLRDQHAIPLIKSITKKSMGQILEEILKQTKETIEMSDLWN
jgi:small subunit ribosomal protein S15